MKPLLLFLVISCVFIASGGFAAKEELPVRRVEDGLSIFDLSKEGKRNWELHGSSAVLENDGYILIQDVDATFYPDKESEGVVNIKTPSAELNQSTKHFRTEQPVSITGTDIEITGTGLNGNMGEKKVRIKRDVKVVLTGKNQNFFFGDPTSDLQK